MALSRKKAVHILSVTEDKIIPLKEIPLPEPPLHMVSDNIYHDFRFLDFYFVQESLLFLTKVLLVMMLK